MNVAANFVESARTVACGGQSWFSLKYLRTVSVGISQTKAMAPAASSARRNRRSLARSSASARFRSVISSASTRRMCACSLGKSWLETSTSMIVPSFRLCRHSERSRPRFVLAILLRTSAVRQPSDIANGHTQELVARVSVCHHGCIVDLQESERLNVVDPHRWGLESKSIR